MKAVVITQPGGPEVLEVQEVPAPTPNAHEVLVDVYATALNRADLLQRQGHYPPPVGAPPYPGLECAGRVVGSTAEGYAAGHQVGQRVMALLSGGGYAEQVAVPAATLMPVPDNLTWEEAAAIPEAWLTAYSNMIQIGRLAQGERVLIHAGASGVGSAAIQLAKLWGATVFTTVSAGKMEDARRFGADVVINYQQESFAERIRQETTGAGVSLIIDFIGAPYWEANIDSLALWGRLVLVGLMGGRETQVNLGAFLSKKLSVHGSTLRDRTLAQKAQLVADFTREILPHLASGTLYPVLDTHTFTLEEIADAHRHMEATRNVGKIVVQVRQE